MTFKKMIESARIVQDHKQRNMENAEECSDIAAKSATNCFSHREERKLNGKSSGTNMSGENKTCQISERKQNTRTFGSENSWMQ